MTQGKDAVTSLTPEQAGFAIAKMAEWARICEDNGRSTRSPDISHSSLLFRLLTGRPALEKSPPRAFSYPWYDLFDCEEAEIRDMWESTRPCHRKPPEYADHPGPVVVVNQHAEYVWETPGKILAHMPTGLRFEYLEKESQPAWVRDGRPEDHKYMGKFLRLIR